MWVLLLGAVFFMGFWRRAVRQVWSRAAFLQYMGGLFPAGRLLEMGWWDAGYIAGGEGIPAGGCGG